MKSKKRSFEFYEKFGLTFKSRCRWIIIRIKIIWENRTRFYEEKVSLTILLFQKAKNEKKNS